jgi:predicted transcriptional regulator
MMDSLQVYQQQYKIIQSIYSSRLKIQILLSVNSGVKSLAELREVTGSTSQALIPKIRGLEHLSLIESRGHGYALTPLGKIITSKIDDFVLTMGELMQHRDFWANHEIEGIPSPFLYEIRDLVDSELKFDTADNIFHVYASYLKILKEAAYIYGISMVLSSEIADALVERIVAGIPTQLIVNRKVAEVLSQEPFSSKLQQLKTFGDFQIWVTDEIIQVGITVTDKHLSLGLNKKEGNLYDSSADLFSSNPKALDWARRLFNYYKARSTRVSL